MSIWCHNWLVITGCEPEIKAVAALLEGPVLNKEHEEVLRDWALAPKHEEMLSRSYPTARLLPLHFERLMPVPFEIPDTDVHTWCRAHWGVRHEPLHIQATADPSGERIEYRFQTPERPPLRWVEQLSSIFPTLGIALHCAAISNLILNPSPVHACESFYCRDGVRVGMTPYMDREVRAAFLQSFFGITLSGTHTTASIDRDTDLLDAPAPVEGITADLIREVVFADSVTTFRNLHARLRRLGLSNAGAYALLARHGREIPEEILEEILNRPNATMALTLRPNDSVSEPFALRAVTKVARRLIEVQFPEDSQDSWNQAHPLVARGSPVSSSLDPLGPPVSVHETAESDTEFRLVWQLYAWRQLLANYFRKHRVALPRLEQEQLISRLEVLQPTQQGPQFLRNALIETLVLSPSTPTHVLREICPPDASGIINDIAAHSNIDPVFCAQLWRDHELSVFAQASVARNPRLVQNSTLIRTILDQQVKIGPPPPAGPFSHPFAIALLMANAPSSEIPAAFEKLAKYPKLVLDLLEILPQERTSLMPRHIWVQLLQSPDREIRERALLCLNTIATDSPSRSARNHDPTTTLSQSS